MKYAIFLLVLLGLSLVGFSNFLSCKQIFDSGRSAGSGVYNICPDGTNCVNVYCNMANGGTASIFVLENELTLVNLSCVFNTTNGDDGGIDDMDSSILWTDLTAKVSSDPDNGQNTSNPNWMTWYRNGTENNESGNLSPRPSGMGDYARPVPLPASGKTVWFDWENETILWDSGSSSFSSVGLSSDLFDNSNEEFNYYVITDGVNMIHVGNEDGDDTGTRLLMFDFQSNTVSGEAAELLVPSNGWWDTEEDAFGHVLYTVNGRVMYFVNFNSDVNVSTFALGGSLSDPNSQYTEYNSSLNGSETNQPGLDFFARVDTDGYLWFGDWGHDDYGLFNCPAEDAYFGVAKSNIQLSYEMSALAPITLEAPSNHVSSKPLSVNFINDSKISCPGDLVELLATSGSDPVSEVSMRLVLMDPYSGLVSEKSTDVNGKVEFDLSKEHEGKYQVSVHRVGYVDPAELTFNFAHCVKPTLPVVQPPTEPKNEVVSQPPPQPLTPPVVEPKTNGEMDDANAALADAKNSIMDATNAGKDSIQAQRKLDEAMAAFNRGDYEQATFLAQNAKQLAISAPALAKPEPVKVNNTNVSPPQNPPTQPTSDSSMWVWILLVLLIVVAGGAYYFYNMRKK